MIGVALHQHNGHDGVHPMREDAGDALAGRGMEYQMLGQLAPVTDSPGQTPSYSSVLFIGQIVLKSDDHYPQRVSSHRKHRPQLRLLQGLQWFRWYSACRNRVSMMEDIRQPIHIYVDTCTIGCGAFVLVGCLPCCFPTASARGGQVHL